MTKRDREIIQLRRAGKPWAKLERRFGISVYRLKKLVDFHESINEFNQNFMEKLMSPTNPSDLRDDGRKFVKVELLESAFAKAVIPQEPSCQ
jgi:hypothetical protein